MDDPGLASSGNESGYDRQAIDAPITVRDGLKGRYVLIRELGRGGFGISYLATDSEVASRKVVVKVLLKHRSEDAWSLNKFRSEMEALARIDHPGVVAVVDFGRLEDGRPFLVMQYISGKSLRELIPQAGMPLARLADIVRQTGRALTAAHDVGVCHRDLKPENIMVQSRTDGEEQVKLIDFGVAEIQDSDVTSESIKVSGTLRYMAPEQFDGKSSPASDIYQLGVLAYEMATGIVPFRSSTPDGFLQQKMKHLKVPPKDLRPDLPDAAQDAILKALSPNPRDRYARARDFGDALAGMLTSTEADANDWSARQDLISTQTEPLSTKSRMQRRRSRRWMLAGASLAMLAVLAGAVTWLAMKPHSPDSVAVLPFDNRMGDPEMAYLTEGITESLINDLSRIPTLRVSARGSVLRYDSAKVDPLVAGRELRVERIVRGSVSRSADELRIEAELMDVHSGSRLWGRTYTHKLPSLSDAFEQFSTEVTDQLRLKLSEPLKERLARQYATHSESYRDYLKGRFHLNKRTADDLETAVRYFEQAIARNAGYAPAHAGLAYTYTQLAMHDSLFGNATPARALEKARAAAGRALELDGTLAEAYTSLAFVQMQVDYQWKAAEKTFQRAIELNPNWADTRECYALELTAEGRFDEGLREIERAESLEPTAWPLKAGHATVLYYARRYDQSLAIINGLATSTRDSLGDVSAQNYWAKSMPAEALEAVLRLPVAVTLRTPLLVSAYARVKRENTARALLAAYPRRQETTPWYYMALAHLSLGEKAEAVRDLERDYERRSAEILFIVVDPLMDGLRNEGRLNPLIARMQLDSKQR